MKKFLKEHKIKSGTIICIISVLTYFGIKPPSCARQDKDNRTEILVDERNNDSTNTSEEIKSEEIKSEYKIESALDLENNRLNGREYVDLGLSVNWAICNVGAIHPEDNGQKYAWGETSPKSSYTWINYDFCFSGHTDDNVELKKYVCEDSRFGFAIDRKETLELSDDVANDNWGKGWRMPTKTEFLELINNCAITWVQKNGHRGYLFTSKKDGFTDKSIFFPVDGNSNSTTYWTSSVKRRDPRMAWGIRFESTRSAPYAQTENRFFGHLVRPVCIIN